MWWDSLISCQVDCVNLFVLVPLLSCSLVRFDVLIISISWFVTHIAQCANSLSIIFLIYFQLNFQQFCFAFVLMFLYPSNDNVWNEEKNESETFFKINFFCYTLNYVYTYTSHTMYSDRNDFLMIDVEVSVSHHNQTSETIQCLSACGSISHTTTTKENKQKRSFIDLKTN